MARRRRLILLAVGAAVVAGLLLFWVRYVEPIRSHSRWYGRVRGDIMELTHKRPPEVSRGFCHDMAGPCIEIAG